MESKLLYGLLFMLLVCAWTDFREKKIYMWLLLLFTLWGVGVRIAYGQWNEEHLFGVLPGIALLVFSVWSHEKIGKGDGYLVAVSGWYLGVWRCILLLFGSLALASFVGVILILLKKCTRTSALPFVPFVLCTYIGMLCFGMIS